MIIKCNWISNLIIAQINKNIIDFLKQVGAVQGSSISKSTFLVVAKNKDEDTGKAEEARKLNIPIMTIEEFASTYQNK